MRATISSASTGRPGCRDERSCRPGKKVECCPERMPVQVKICGITNLADGIAAAEAGADALGFVFYNGSPRRVPLETATAIARGLPPLIVKVGVFVNAPEEEVTRAIDECGLNLLQFHGQEPPEYCLQFGLMCMKAFQIR